MIPAAIRDNVVTKVFRWKREFGEVIVLELPLRRDRDRLDEQMAHLVVRPFTFGEYVAASELVAQGEYEPVYHYIRTECVLWPDLDLDHTLALPPGIIAQMLALSQFDDEDALKNIMGALDVSPETAISAQAASLAVVTHLPLETIREMRFADYAGLIATVGRMNGATATVTSAPARPEPRRIGPTHLNPGERGPAWAELHAEQITSVAADGRRMYQEVLRQQERIRRGLPPTVPRVDISRDLKNIHRYLHGRA